MDTDEGLPDLQHKALHLDPRLGKVQQQADAAASRLQMIQTLRPMNIIERLDDLQFDQHRQFHQEVDRIFTNDDARIPDRHPVLLLSCESRQTKLVSKSVLVQFFKKPGPKLIADLKRAPDDPLRNAVQFTIICVHLWFQIFPAHTSRKTFQKP